MHKVEVPILNNEYWVYVIWGKKEECLKFIKRHLKKDYVEIYDGVRGQTFGCEEYEPIIYMAMKPNEEHFWATLAHESCHAINRIWDYIGETTRTDEIYAHSIGAILAHVEKYIKK